MSSNEILEEVWRIKDQLWREADGDMQKFCDQLREWSDKHPTNNPVLRTPEEIRRYLKEGILPETCVREDPPKYGG